MGLYRLQPLLGFLCRTPGIGLKILCRRKWVGWSRGRRESMRKRVGPGERAAEVSLSGSSRPAMWSDTGGKCSRRPVSGLRPRRLQVHRDRCVGGCIPAAGARRQEEAGIAASSQHAVSGNGSAAEFRCVGFSCDRTGSASGGSVLFGARPSIGIATIEGRALPGGAAPKCRRKIHSRQRSRLPQVGSGRQTS